jgi:hypothetical protein
VQLESNQKNAMFWTFFGFEDDDFEITEKTFMLNKLVTDY